LGRRGACVGKPLNRKILGKEKREPRGSAPSAAQSVDRKPGKKGQRGGAQTRLACKTGKGEWGGECPGDYVVKATNSQGNAIGWNEARTGRQKKEQEPGGQG